ncbi:carboxymuconolactone decarboxylase family protein [Streptomyces lavendulae]|uniref:carboxymuconolactone decarboxylase family protein n=1 Tax=Streptomyces lavendulae TaxID=1914 RepID=UPI00249FF4FF|nr:carboxymuconolactone decarboxylase family protein [Streptomyces lavendulae]GLX20733.1 alkyl hydroperoxide reductase AhpD [Streptomyces lavendulae subsp. lavendulae]GLX28105.1 alkyl hydroperoxide reductase AhpD [Streptomyces lavendulae subsp. lavendulae]
MTNAPATISRMPNPGQFVPELSDISAALFRATGNHSVPRTTISLVHLRAGQIVHNTYLTILNTAFLRKAGETEERITAVSSWQDAPYFTPAERAALALVEATLQPAPRGQERVPDELYAEVAEHYDEKALATLTIAIGQINFFIALAVIGKPQPVASLADQQWD